jgi:hypothetical protein
LALSHGTSYLGYSARSSKGAFHPFFAGGAPPSPSAMHAASPRTVLGRQSSGAFGGGASPRAPHAGAPPAGALFGGGGGGPSPARRRSVPGSPGGSGGGNGGAANGAAAGGNGGGGAAAAHGVAAGAMLPPGCRSVDPDAADEEQRRREGGGGGGGGPAGGDVSVPLITCGRDSPLMDVSRGAGGWVVVLGGVVGGVCGAGVVVQAAVWCWSRLGLGWLTVDETPPSPRPPQVLHLMVNNSVHRIYVYEPDASPAVTGVVTPSDILRLLVTLGLGGGGGAGADGGVGGAAAGVSGPGGMVLARPGSAAAKKARVD